MKKNKATFQSRRKQTTNDIRTNTPTFSYRANRLTTEQAAGNRLQPRRKSRLRSLQWHHVPTILISCVVFISLIYVLSLSTDPRIIVLENGQNDPSTALLQDVSVYHQAAQQILAANLADRSKITIDSNAFEDRMRQQFPELSDATITLPLMGRRPIVELITAQPALILTDQSGAYVIDVNGRAVGKASNIQGLRELQLPTIEDQSGDIIKQGQGELSSQSVTFITTFIKQLTVQHIQLSSIALPLAPSELQVHITNEPYYIKASLLTDPAVAAGSFLALKQKLDSDHIVPQDYVDVRVEGKVYYK